MVKKVSSSQKGSRVLYKVAYSPLDDRVNSSVLVFFMAKVALVFALYCILINQADYAIDIGFTRMQAAAAFSIVGGVSIFSKIFWGAVSDRIGREMTFTIIVGLGAPGHPYPDRCKEPLTGMDAKYLFMSVRVELRCYSLDSLADIG